MEAATSACAFSALSKPLTSTTLRFAGSCLWATEEGLQALLLDLGKIADFLDLVVGGIDGAGRNGNDLVVLISTVDHLQHADGTNPDDGARNDRFARVDECVERIAVTAEQAGDGAVVGRIDDRHRLSDPDDAAGLGVDFVLGEASLRNFDRREELLAIVVRLREIEIGNVGSSGDAGREKNGSGREIIAFIGDTLNWYCEETPSAYGVCITAMAYVSGAGRSSILVIAHPTPMQRRVRNCLVTHDEKRGRQNQAGAEPQVARRRMAEDHPAGENVERQLQVVEGLDIGGIGGAVGQRPGDIAP